MKRTRIVFWVVCVAALVWAGTGGLAAVRAQGDTLTGTLINIAEIPLGEALLTDVAGGTLVQIAATGFDPVAGGHRLIIAEAGVCEAPSFASAGQAVVELPNAQLFANGVIDYEQVIPDLTLAQLRDANGSALVLYADAGETPGDRIACAVLAGPGAPPVQPTATPPPPAPPPTEPIVVPPEELDAYATDLIMGLGIPLGVAAFVEDDGFLGIAIEAAGFDPIASSHRVALTEVGRCEPPDFTSAGNEILVLEDLFITGAGTVEYVTATDAVTLEGLLDANGSAIVIYAGQGEDAGPRIACGVITTTPIPTPAPTVVPPTPTVPPPPPEPTAPPTPRISEEELSAALIALGDLPTGWTPWPDMGMGDGGANDNFICRSDIPNNYAAVSAGYLMSDVGPFLFHGVAAYDPGQAQADFARWAGGFQQCSEWRTREVDGTETVWRVSPISFPNVGDETIAMRMVTDVELYGQITADVVLVRSGDYLTHLLYMEVGSDGIDSSQTEQFARLAVSKLGSVR